MPRKYTCEFEAQSWLNADGDIDIWEITPADDKPIAVTGLVIKTTSEIKEAEEEWLRLRVIRGFTSSGSGAPTTASPVPLSAADAAAGFTVELLNDTVATTGSTVNLHSDAFNVRNGYEIWLPPEDWWWCSQASTTLVIRGMAAPTDDVTISSTVYVMEVP